MLNVFIAEKIAGSIRLCGTTNLFAVTAAKQFMKSSMPKKWINSTSGSANEYIALNDSVRNALIVRGKDIARKTTSALQKHLKKAIKEEGFEYAVNFCYTKAMELTDSVSEAESVTVRRLAKKYRNPVNETDPEESELFKSYILEWLGGRPLSPKIDRFGSDGTRYVY